MDSKDLPLQVGVKALLKNSEERFLLLRRNPEKYPGVKHSWDIPGGRIHTQIPLLENLRREIKEETGLELIQTPQLAAAQDIMKGDRHIVRLTYVGDIDGNPVIDSDSTEYRWVTKDELVSLPELDSYLRELIETKVITL